MGDGHFPLGGVGHLQTGPGGEGVKATKAGRCQLRAQNRRAIGLIAQPVRLQHARFQVNNVEALQDRLLPLVPLTLAQVQVLKITPQAATAGEPPGGRLFVNAVKGQQLKRQAPARGQGCGRMLQ